MYVTCIPFRVLFIYMLPYKLINFTCYLCFIKHNGLAAGFRAALFTSYNEFLNCPPNNILLSIISCIILVESIHISTLQSRFFPFEIIEMNWYVPILLPPFQKILFTPYIINFSKENLLCVCMYVGHGWTKLTNTWYGSI